MKMNKVLLILIFFIFSSDFYAQKKCYEDSVDARGYIVSECLRSSKYIDFNEKLMSEPGTGIILYRSSMQPFTGKCQGCFFNDKLWFKMELQSGKKNGPYIVNYKSGCPKEKGYEIMGIKHGKYLEYFDSTKIVSLKQNYNKGAMNGEQVLFNKDGDTLSLENYRNNVLHGKQSSFFPNLILNIESNYLNGNLHGKYSRYSYNNKLLLEINYSKGKYHGKKYKYYDNGNIMLEESWTNGKKQGEFKSFFISGETKSYEKYLNNKEEGEFEEKYENGIVKRQAIYKKGKLICETKYDEYGQKIVGKKEGDKKSKKGKKDKKNN